MLLRQAVAAGAAAPAAALAYAASFPFREWLFGVTEADALPPPVRIARDTLLALALALPLATLGASLVLNERSARTWRVSRLRVLGIACGAFLAAAALGGSVRAADPGPGAPCPTGAPLKSFDVQAINVDITLNRFGDHDPTGKMYVLSSRVAAVRAQETAPLPNRVSIGLREDAIQPLVVRANEGDCVEINFTNNASGGPYGVHIDGLSFESGSSGDAVGQNFPSDVGLGSSRTYRYYVPDDPTLEGAHYLRPGPGNRAAVQHGLFGVLVVEPPKSSYLNMTTGAPLESGWEASILPGNGKRSFREFVQVYHEIGGENFLISTKNGGFVPLVDPITTSYRPDARAMNYRSEAFLNRLRVNDKQESLAYGSYAFGDPATPMMRGYLHDPTKIRLVHGGGEMFHVFHLHGGGDRWRFNPLADTTNDYGATDGVNKPPPTESSPSVRLDSQAFGPGESYNLEIEGGAGGVQHAAGDFLYHCHIAEHYISGMWSFWRVYDTLQPDLVPLPDRTAPYAAVDSAGLIGLTFNGTTITAANLDDWIRAQLPPQGVQRNDQDASVWNWTIDKSNPSAPVYLGEPEDRSSYPDLPNIDPNHPGSLITDLAPGQIVSTPTGDRPKIMFDPRNGRPAWPLMRPHIGKRPPFSPNGHSGAPWLGENIDAANSAGAAVDPFADRADALCPADAPLRRFNVVAITLPIRNTRTLTDPTGMIYTLAHDKADVYAGTKPAQPLAIRSNIGDCDAVTLTSEETDATQASGFAKVNMHIHHVQFDPQASDGVITGMSYEQSVRPYKAEDPTLTAPVVKGATALSLSSVTKFLHTCAGGGTCDNVWIGIGLGTDSIEVRQVASVDTSSSTVTLTAPLSYPHAVGDAAGTEFTQYRWYPDVMLDNIFWHDHVDGIHNWGHGLVGQLIIEPKGSTYWDPKYGTEVDSGTIVDIHTSNPLVNGVVTGSFRELALWTIDENPNTDATLNLKAEPWADRLAKNPDPSLLFSSYTHGDPITPLPLAYPGDPLVIRTINVGPTVDGLHIDGHRFTLENRYQNGGKSEASQADTLHYGISEKDTLVLDAGGPLHRAGDYLYENSIGRKFRDGAWGLIRVLPGLSSDLLPLPDTTPPPAASLPVQTGGRPPAAAGPGHPCPAGMTPTKTFSVSAVDLRPAEEVKYPDAAFVPSSLASAARARGYKAQPLVLHVAAGTCFNVAFTNLRSVRSSFHLDLVESTPESGGVNAGFTPEQTVAPGGARTYRFYADGDRYETGLVSDYGGANAAVPLTGLPNPQVDPGLDGMYGAVEVAPAGATFSDPVLGVPTDTGTQVDVHVPGKPGYRDFTVFLADQDPRIGQNTMPYPDNVKGPAAINYATAGARPDGPNMFNSALNAGDPATPLLRAYPGDPLVVHAIGAPGNEQTHVFSLGGLSWPLDPLLLPYVDSVEARALAPMNVVDAHVSGGAGGRGHAAGDYFYGDLRRPFTVAGMWGLQRVLDPAGCPINGLDGSVCGQPIH
jgi:FtsP/CotA-like multicopper oxidase with cupredoxin domain